MTDGGAGRGPVPPLGIMMLDAAFPRPPGDVGHPSSWPFPVLFRTVPAATVRRVVDGQDDDLLDAFVEAGEGLVRDGAVALTTSCGFLAARQRDLAGRLPVPVGTSSLLLLPLADRTCAAGRRAGVVTYDADALTGRHLAAAGADGATPVAGLPPSGRFRGLIEGGEPYDAAALRDEVLGAVRRLLDRHPEVGALLLECTNLPPFAADIAGAFGLPVFDILTLGRMLHAAALPSTFRPR